MGCGCNSTNNTCGEKHFAGCTFYESPLPVFTTLAAANCYTLEEIIADIYLIETGIKGELDLTDLLSNGIAYALVEGEVVTKNALKKHAELIIILQDIVAKLQGGTEELFDISDWDLDYNGIADSCGDNPDKLRDLIQLIISNNFIKPYKSYVANLTQTGTNAPVVTVMESDFSGEVVWTRSGTGLYRGTLTGEFTASKVAILLGGNASSPDTTIRAVRSNDDYVQITTNSGFSAVDTVLNETTIEIRIYS